MGLTTLLFETSFIEVGFYSFPELSVLLNSSCRHTFFLPSSPLKFADFLLWLATHEFRNWKGVSGRVFNQMTNGLDTSLGFSPGEGVGFYLMQNWIPAARHGQREFCRTLCFCLSIEPSSFAEWDSSFTLLGSWGKAQTATAAPSQRMVGESPWAG